MSVSNASRPKLIYLVTEDWYFWSHRLPMARAARDAGFDVAVATRVDEHRARIEGEGFRVHPLFWRRRAVSPIDNLRAVAEIVALYRRERPDVVHHVAVKPTVLGAAAAVLAGVPGVVNALTGMGYTFTGDDLRSRLLRLPIGLALRFLLNRRGSRLILQNPDDRAMLERAGLIRGADVVLIRGSGIDTGHYQPLPEPPADPVRIAVVARMLDSKGIPVLVEAYQRLRARGVDCGLILAGDPDPENPTSIPRARLEAWAREPGVSWLGSVADVRTVWRDAHIAVLPAVSREGLPKSLLEAAACGRPIVASDVSGCREVARPGENALLVPPGDPAALADALAVLIGDADRRRRLGEAGRRLVLSDLAAERVGARVVEVYRGLLPAAAPPLLPRVPRVIPAPEGTAP